MADTKKLELWETEPDKFDFGAHGLKCAARRGPCKQWCGYVAVPKEHPLHGYNYSVSRKISKPAVAQVWDTSGEDREWTYGLYSEEFDCGFLSPEAVFRVHGGLTYSGDKCPTNDPDGNWWFGFDCAHAGDFIPYDGAVRDLVSRHDGDIYRDLTFVIAQCEHLAKQLIDYAAAAPPVDKE